MPAISLPESQDQLFKPVIYLMFPTPPAKNGENNEIRLYDAAAPGSENRDWEERPGRQNSMGIAIAAFSGRTANLPPLCN
jgi:hypothetical protein